jgi:hypothetical protein
VTETVDTRREARGGDKSDTRRRQERHEEETRATRGRDKSDTRGDKSDTRRRQERHDMEEATTTLLDPTPQQLCEMRIRVAQRVILEYEEFIDEMLQRHGNCYETFKSELTRQVQFKYAHAMFIFNVNDLNAWAYGGALETLFQKIYRKEVQFFEGIFGSIWVDSVLKNKMTRLSLTRLSLDYSNDSERFCIYLDATFDEEW